MNLKKKDISTYRDYKIDKAEAIQKNKEERDLYLKGQDKVSNFAYDLGTNIATLGTQFRYPSQQELEAGRKGGLGRAKILSDAAA
jgi:hypothetical protein